jgi:predicted O-methyltransferase YrrM
MVWMSSCLAARWSFARSRLMWVSTIFVFGERFDSNLADFGERVEKIKSASSRGLAPLITEERRFDLVYIDGSHHSADVQADAMLSWPMIQGGGVVIFDDYLSQRDRPPQARNRYISVSAYQSIP